MGYKEILTPDNCAVTLIDYQPAMFFGVQSHDRMSILLNAAVLAKTAKLFHLPMVLSTVAKDSFSGPLAPELTSLYPGQEIDRVRMPRLHIWQRRQPALPSFRLAAIWFKERPH